MIRAFAHKLRRFGRADDGNATIEFAIMFPLFFVFLLSSVEVGLLTLKYSFLERGLDLAVRDVRLSTGATPDHTELKKMICDGAVFIADCEDKLLIEMIQVDPRDWQGIPETATCTDQAEEVQPVTTFTAGMDNELMIIRACAKVPAIYPTLGFGTAVDTDSSGDIALVAISAFVQEPR